MGTGSTKSRNVRQSNSQRGGTPARDDSGSSPVAGGEMSQLTWLVSGVAILTLGAILRIYNLNLVPLHHDEGVNGNFLVRLVRDGFYHYDPANYHGPTLYYFAALFPRMMKILFGVSGQNTYGLTTTAVRMVPVLCGLGTIALVFTLRRNLGTIATLSAAFFLAISPGAVYLSRYFIHETLFVFFTMGVVVAALKFYESGSGIHILLGAISLALLFATKETAIISVGVLAIALVTTLAFHALNRSFSGGKKKRQREAYSDEDQDGSFRERAGGPRTIIVWTLVAIVVFMAINVLLYSSFFTNYPKGVSDALKTFQFWTKTGKEAHVHPFATYVWWLLLQESPLLILGAAGAVLAILKPTRPFALFAAQWAFGLIAAYSLIAYKTPWLALNFIVPLALASGVTIEWLYDSLGRLLGTRARVVAVVVVVLFSIGPLPGVARAFAQVTDTSPFPGLVTGLANIEPKWKTFIPGYQTIDLNFINYDNDDRYYVYVYAHTRRETLKLVDEINRLVERTHQGGDTGITIVSPDYWPLPWYLRDYRRVGYFGRMTPSTEPIIIASQSQAAEVQSTFGDRYQQIHSGVNTLGSYPLRPGVDLLIYARRELIH